MVARTKGIPGCQTTRVDLEHTLQRLIDAAEALLAELDEMDGDPDLEPLLGSSGDPSSYFDQRHWATGATDDREEQCEGGGGEEGDEREPEPGDLAPTYHPEDQRRILSAQFGDHVIYTDVG